VLQKLVLDASPNMQQQWKYLDYLSLSLSPPITTMTEFLSYFDQLEDDGQRTKFIREQFLIHSSEDKVTKFENEVYRLYKLFLKNKEDPPPPPPPQPPSSDNGNKENQKASDFQEPDRLMQLIERKESTSDDSSPTESAPSTSSNTNKNNLSPLRLRKLQDQERRANMGVGLKI
jgi:hypothetical protein